jgi:hypothetical protein
MTERKHADLWRELVDEAGEDEIDRAVNVSVAQAEAELTAAGFDVAAERAKAGAFLDALETGSGTSRSEEATRRPAEAGRRKRPRSAVPWLAAAATLAAAGAVLYATLHPSPEPVAKGHPAASTPTPIGPSADELRVAAELRRKAAAACDAKQWGVCLAELDEARAVDPDGDTGVTPLRDKAIAGILEPTEAPPPGK